MGAVLCGRFREEACQKQQATVVYTPRVEQTAPLFTALPLDVRLTIWEHLFSDEDVFWLADGAKSPALSPAFVCKQIFEEIRCIVPSRITIGLRSHKLPSLLKSGEFTILNLTGLARVRRVCVTTSSLEPYMSSTLQLSGTLANHFGDLRMVKWIPIFHAAYRGVPLVPTTSRSHAQHIKWKHWRKILVGDQACCLSTTPDPTQVCEALRLILSEKNVHWPIRYFAEMREWAKKLQAAAQGRSIQCIIELGLVVGEKYNYKSKPKEDPMVSML